MINEGHMHRVRMAAARGAKMATAMDGWRAEREGWSVGNPCGGLRPTMPIAKVIAARRSGSYR